MSPSLLQKNEEREGSEKEREREREREGERMVQRVCAQFFWITPASLSLSSLPWAIPLNLTCLVLIQITRTMQTNGNHVSLHEPHKNALVQIPMTPLLCKIYSRVLTAQAAS